MDEIPLTRSDKAVLGFVIILFMPIYLVINAKDLIVDWIINRATKPSELSDIAGDRIIARIERQQRK
jgi:hypothetical protein